MFPSIKAKSSTYYMWDLHKCKSITDAETYLFTTYTFSKSHRNDWTLLVHKYPFKYSYLFLKKNSLSV